MVGDGVDHPASVALAAGEPDAVSVRVQLLVWNGEFPAANTDSHISPPANLHGASATRTPHCLAAFRCFSFLSSFNDA